MSIGGIAYTVSWLRMRSRDQQKLTGMAELSNPLAATIRMRREPENPVEAVLVASVHLPTT